MGDGNGGGRDPRELELIEAAYADAFTSSDAGGTTVDAQAPTEQPQYPGYDVIRVIRRGAQGTVFEAVQQQTRRRVAIKLLHGGDFASQRIRFEREVQILAQLNHPHIVTIHDSIVSDDRAYFVMDYIAGHSVDEYLRRHKLAPRAILRLFAAIGDAVNAAHLQGVIHRDLKPSNIRINESGMPQVLDFGLAKTTTADLTTDSDDVLTQTGQFVGSLPWASPEQAEGSDDGIDVRTDVYALGVMLYQALTGAFPYPVTGSMRAVVEHICTMPPRRPSSLNAALNDEIDTIVLKCLAKERDRRYQSAGELTRDLERCLAGDPIEAKRDSSLYLLRKTIQRHRLPFAAAATVLVMLIAFTAVITVLFGQVQQQRDQAVAARLAESIARENAETEADKARRVQLFLAEMLHAANPFNIDAEITMSAVLTGAADRLNAEAIDDPQVEAGIRHALGIGFRGVGDYEEAEVQMRAAETLLKSTVADDHLDVLNIRITLAQVLHERGALDAAESLARATLAALEKQVDNHHLTTLEAHYTLGTIWKAQGRYAEAETTIAAVLERRRELLGDDDIHTLETLSGLAKVHKLQGDLESAAGLFREAFQRYESALGPRHPQTLTALDNLATILQDQGKLDEAESCYRWALANQAEVLGEDHPHRLSTLNNLGTLLRDQGRAGEAEPLIREALIRRRVLLGDAHPSTLNAMNNLGLVLIDQRRSAEAEAIYRELLELGGPIYGEDYPDLLTWLSNLASVLAMQEKWADARPLGKRVLDIRLKELGETHPRTLTAMNNYAALLQRSGEPVKAVVWSRRAWETARERLGPSHYSTLAFQTNHGRCLAAAADLAAAEPILLDAHQRLKGHAGADHPYTRRARQYVVDMYTSWGRLDEAARFESESN